MIFTGGYTIQAADLPLAVTTNAQGPPGSKAGSWTDAQYLAFARTYLEVHAGERALEGLMEKMEKSLIVEALRRCDGNQTHAARLLGLPRPTLHLKMQKHGLQGLGERQK